MENTTVIQAIQSFKEWKGLEVKERTINGYFRSLLHFCMFLRNVNLPISKVGYEDCIEWLKLVRVLGYDHNTTIKQAIALKMMFKFLEKKREPISFDPDLIPIPDKIFKIPRIAKPEDFKRLIAAVPKKHAANYRDRAIIYLLYDTGARNDEITSLKVLDLNFERKSAGILTEKSKGIVPFREIFWTDNEADKALRDWMRIRKNYIEREGIIDSGYLFIGIKNGFHRTKGDRMSVSYVSEILRKYSTKAGLPAPLNPHSLRHLFGRDLAIAGENNSNISSLLGHARVQSSYPYTQLFGQQRKDVYDRSRQRPGA